MPNVTVEWAEGRTIEQKRELVKAITEVVAKIGKTRPERIRVEIIDLPFENLSQNGILKLDEER